MILINLLPHREESAAQEARSSPASAWPRLAWRSSASGTWCSAAADLPQQARNDFLKAEIKRLEVQIKDIATLRRDRIAQGAPEGRGRPADRPQRAGAPAQRTGQADAGASTSRASKQDGQVVMVTGIAQTRSASRNCCATRTTARWLETGSGREQVRQCASDRQQGAAALFEFAMRLKIKRPRGARWPGARRLREACRRRLPAPNKA